MDSVQQDLSANVRLTNIIVSHNVSLYIYIFIPFSLAVNLGTCEEKLLEGSVSDIFYNVGSYDPGPI
jgi:hypothetical protein